MNVCFRAQPSMQRTTGIGCAKPSFVFSAANGSYEPSLTNAAIRTNVGFIANPTDSPTYEVFNLYAS